jgi:hypothetical protein
MKISSATAASLAALILVIPNGSFALQHRWGAAHQPWVVPAGSNYTIEQRLIVSAPSPDDTYYSLNIRFDPHPNPDDGAYIGLQPGSGQRQFLFSIWNAQRASPGAGASCGTFGNEGSGLHCSLPLQADEAVVGTTYTFRIRPVDLNDPSGPWWEGAVVGEDGAERVIGWVQGPAGLGLISSAVSFVEFFGQDADGSCDCVTLPPVARGIFSRPLLNSASYADYGSDTRGDCSGGRVTRVPDYLCSVIELGVDTASSPGPNGEPVYGPMQCTPCQQRSNCPTGQLCQLDGDYGICG